MAVSKDKTRITISVSSTTANRWRALAKHFGMPPAVLSNCLDEILSGLCDLMEEAQREGRMDIAMLQKFTGAQMEKAEQTEGLKPKGDQRGDTGP